MAYLTSDPVDINCLVAIFRNNYSVERIIPSLLQLQTIVSTRAP